MIGVAEALIMSTQNKCFYAELRIICIQIHPLIQSYELQQNVDNSNTNDSKFLIIQSESKVLFEAYVYI